ncbi:R3H domain-containing protein 4-like [Saccoglossus kowalevskii]|uniref:R3H domain-containing protein 4-like n=1 Tax=Saccoglossus kowalevskii TaxID=10224 RepID=A0ABM0M9L8_SACKO|nr:PREDICTED: R3H domain-containing protein 4-like [Saccoglossus kowalevskii]
MGIQKVDEDSVNHAHFQNQPELIDDDEDSSIPIQPKSPKTRKQRAPNSPRPQTFMKEKGVRHARRYANTCYLLDMVDCEEFGEVTISDFMECHQTVFGELLTDKASMKIWSDFVNHPEDQQEEFLLSLEGKETVKEDKDGDTEKKSKSEIVTEDKRTDHPAAYTARPDQCFKRINGRLKTLLHRRHLPKGTLEVLEDEVLFWFQLCPDAVFISLLTSSFDRLLLHAVCQYMDLKSRSDEFEGIRHTEVVNSRTGFVPPEMKLSQYVETFS